MEVKRSVNHLIPVVAKYPQGRLAGEIDKIAEKLLFGDLVDDAGSLCNALFLFCLGKRKRNPILLLMLFYVYEFSFIQVYGDQL